MNLKQYFDANNGTGVYEPLLVAVVSIAIDFARLLIIK